MHPNCRCVILPVNSKNVKWETKTCSEMIKEIDFKIKINAYLLEGDITCVDVNSVKKHIDELLDKRLSYMNVQSI